MLVDDIDVVLERHRWWCRGRRRDPMCRSLDGDDVESEAMRCIWAAHEWMHKHPNSGKELLAVAGGMFQRAIASMYKQSRRVTRMPRSTILGSDVVAELADPDDLSPPVLLAAAEEVDRLIRADHAYRSDATPIQISRPCRVCGTTGGRIAKDCARPNRIKGMCNRCYDKHCYDERLRRARATP